MHHSRSAHTALAHLVLRHISSVAAKTLSVKTVSISGNKIVETLAVLKQGNLGEQNNPLTGYVFLLAFPLKQPHAFVFIGYDSPNQ